MNQGSKDRKDKRQHDQGREEAQDKTKKAKASGRAWWDAEKPEAAVSNDAGGDVAPEKGEANGRGDGDGGDGGNAASSGAADGNDPGGGAGGSDGGSGGSGSPGGADAELRARLEEKDRLCREYLDRLQRNAAEFDNYKKRTQREKEALYLDASADVIGAFLPIVDSLDRAVHSLGGLACPDAGSGADARGDGPGADACEAGAGADDTDACEAGAGAGAAGPVAAPGSLEASLTEGLLLIDKQVKDVLRKFSVGQLPGIGEQFDPNLHNAVMHVEDENFGKNTIVDVFQKGYIYKDRVIRHSMVKVAN
jgi:molecular chaperone GrpE